MGRLIFSAITSLDLYVADREGNFDWAVPDGDVHAFVNELERSIGTYLYGRRLYETMRFWEAPDLTGQPSFALDYAAIWQTADKVVYSSTLAATSTARTRIEHSFDPDVVRGMKEDAERDLSVGGPTLAAHAFRAGLVDEVHLFLTPVLVGGGTRALPDDVFAKLDLLDERRFGNGVVHLHHGVGG